jgi:hypothetical protein
MATDAIRAQTRSKAAGRAAKERRQKIALIVGLVILGGLVAFEGPKTLKSLQGSDSNSSARTAAPSAGTVPGAPTTSAPAAPRTVDLSSLRGYAVKNPFKPQLGTSTGAAASALRAVAPAVRSTHFVAKDPFVPQLSATTAVAPASTPGTAPTAAPAATRGGYIVMLASIYTGRGRAKAAKAAAKARARHVPNVRIALSSDYPTLRTGFYAVYSGPYTTLGRALAMLQTIRGHGYVSAYTRRLAR